MPSNDTITRYQTLTASLIRWNQVQNDAYSLTLYNRASAHIAALSDALDDMETAFPFLIRLTA
jgi:hypothetical protein